MHKNSEKYQQHDNNNNKYVTIESIMHVKLFKSKYEFNKITAANPAISYNQKMKLQRSACTLLEHPPVVSGSS